MGLFASHLQWEHIIEGFLVGLSVAGAIALARFLGRTQRRVRREHHALIHWARVVGRHIGFHFPLEDETNDDDEL